MNKAIKEELKLIILKHRSLFKDGIIDMSPLLDDLAEFIESKLNQVRKETAESLKMEEKPAVIKGGYQHDKLGNAIIGTLTYELNEFNPIFFCLFEVYTSICEKFVCRY